MNPYVCIVYVVKKRCVIRSCDVLEDLGVCMGGDNGIVGESIIQSTAIPMSVLALK